MTLSPHTTASAVWWMLLLRGALTIAFGVIAWTSPGIALLALVFVFASYAVLEGVTAIVVGLRYRRTGAAHWAWSVVHGAVSVIAGLVAVLAPGATAVAVLLIIGAWAVVGGVAEVLEGVIANRGGSRSWGWMVAAGVVNVVFGFVLLLNPDAGVLAVLWAVGLFSVLTGIVLVARAFLVRRAPTGVTTR